MARLTLRRYKPIVIGITGSVGKTSAKYATAAVLSKKFRVRFSAKSFNNEFGLPLTILGDWPTTGGFWFWLKVLFVAKLRLIFKSRRYPEVLVLEYGVDRPGDMRKLLELVRPTIGVVTAMGEIPVHVEFFSGSEAVAREKSKLVQQLPATGFAVLNIDDPAVYNMASETRSRIVTFGFNEKALVHISNFETIFTPEFKGVTFKLNHSGSFVPVKLANVLGRSQALSAAAAAAVGLAFNLNLVDIAEGLSNYQPPEGRLRVIAGIKESTLIDDSYNASPAAMAMALETLKNIKAKRKIAVLGDMLEIGKYTFEAHREIGQKAAEVADLLITVGLRGKIISESAIESGLAEKSVFHFMKVGEAGLFLQKKIRKNDLILIKGSQGVRLERVVKEVMAEPEKAEKLLVRQDKRWLKKPGLYD